jgi:hypothetical protein
MTVAAVIAVLGFNVAAAALGWPGLIIVNAVCARLGIYLHESPTWEWIIAGSMIDLALYTGLFFVCARLWRMLSARDGD